MLFICQPLFLSSHFISPRICGKKIFFDGFKQTSRCEYGYLFCMPTDALRSHSIAGVFFMCDTKIG